MLSIKECEINKLFDRLSSEMKVYIPQDIDKDNASFELYKEGSKLSSLLNTKRSAKDFFFPQIENLMEFRTNGKEIEVIDNREELEDYVIFGVRACDAKSFDILDRVYLVQEPVDTYYKNRREHGIVITTACFRPNTTCFCPLYGIDAVHNPGGDIAAFLSDGVYYFEANTEKGKALLAKLELEDTEAKSLEADQKKAAEVFDKLPFAHLDLSVFKEKSLLDIFNMPLWKELSESCLGCGTCTFVCPTCQCFDIRDFDTGNGIKRFRCWDSCMYSDFTKMAAENPRLTQTERFRQRFMHKMVYYPEKYEGTYSCVGCGRCLNQCPISMNIVKVIKKIGEAKDAE